MTLYASKYNLAKSIWLNIQKKNAINVLQKWLRWQHCDCKNIQTTFAITDTFANNLSKWLRPFLMHSFVLTINVKIFLSKHMIMFKPKWAYQQIVKVTKRTFFGQFRAYTNTYDQINSIINKWVTWTHHKLQHYGPHIRSENHYYNVSCSSTRVYCYWNVLYFISIKRWNTICYVRLNDETMLHNVWFTRQCLDNQWNLWCKINCYRY